jgi:pyruvate/2-oxoacid:ferredoxin oxidoreductase alpha subunit/NAD-dependent dihydropyrimidine dehydrogenase PreA subunit
MATRKRRPILEAHYCKGCGRCIEACAHGCIATGTAIDPGTGLVPVLLDLEKCSGCGLCLDACPEPYGLLEEAATTEFAILDPAVELGPRVTTAPAPMEVPDQRMPFVPGRSVVVKGTYAAAMGALAAGCRHFYGYPITPSTEGAELMARMLPSLDGVFVQAVSEVAAINFMYGCGAAGLRTMTFTSSPGFSLMLEGVSYMIGAEVPAVIVNVMRGGPGLGNIGPEQSDIKLACRGLGHGNTHAIVLAPSTPQEMLDLTADAFDLSMTYRNPVVVLADGYLGQMTGRVTLPDHVTRPGVPSWAVYGDRRHRGNLISSIQLSESDLEAHNIALNAKYERMRAEQRADVFEAKDADLLVVACNTPARMAKGAVRALRQRGVRAGLFRPITLWPFPIEALRPLLHPGLRILVVEASAGQLEDELRLALSHEERRTWRRIDRLRHYGGILPRVEEIVDAALDDAVLEGVPA